MKTIPVFCFLFFTSVLIYGQDTISKKILDTSTIKDLIEIDASFPGGDKAWENFLGQNLDWSVPFNNGAPKGDYRVVIKFGVDKEGYLTNIQAEDDPGYGTAQEAVRVIKKSPRWHPGMQNNNVVFSWRRQPITFQVTKGKKKNKKNTSVPVSLRRL